MAEVRVAKETRAALTADHNIRCLLKTRYRLESRHSKVAIEWAKSRVDKLTRAMLEELGLKTTNFSVQLNIIDLIGLREAAYICYDLFVEKCDEHVRSEIDQSLERPLHLITRRAKVHHVRRGDKTIEGRVAYQLKQTSEEHLWRGVEGRQDVLFLANNVWPLPLAAKPVLLPIRCYAERYHAWFFRPMSIT